MCDRLADCSEQLAVLPLVSGEECVHDDSQYAEYIQVKISPKEHRYIWNHNLIVAPEWRQCQIDYRNLIDVIDWSYRHHEEQTFAVYGSSERLRLLLSLFAEFATAHIGIADECVDGCSGGDAQLGQKVCESDGNLIAVVAARNLIGNVNGCLVLLQSEVV